MTTQLTFDGFPEVTHRRRAQRLPNRDARGRFVPDELPGVRMTANLRFGPSKVGDVSFKPKAADALTKLLRESDPRLVQLNPKRDGQEDELFIFTEIGAEGATANDIRTALAEIGKKAPLSVRINSPGGSAFDGIAIFNLLRQREGKVTVHIDGMALSAASIIAMAGDEVVMAENALFMIHDPWMFTIGDAQDHRDAATMLDKAATSAAVTYASKTKLDKSQIRELMVDETWLNAVEAQKLGFVDTVAESSSTKAFGNLKQYRKAPSSLLEHHDCDRYPTLTRDDIAALCELFEADPQNKTPPWNTQSSNPASTKATDKDTSKMDIRLLKALGLPENADETTVVAAVAKLDERAGRFAEIEEITGKAGAQALGIVRGWQASAASLDTVAEQLADVKAKQEAQERDTLIAEGLNPKAPKLTKESAKFWANKDPSELRAFLETAPVLIQAAHGQPPVTDTTTVVTVDEYREMKPMQRHNFRKRDEKQHDAIAAQARADR